MNDRWHEDSAEWPDDTEQVLGRLVMSCRDRSDSELFGGFRDNLALYLFLPLLLPFVVFGFVLMLLQKLGTVPPRPVGLLLLAVTYAILVGGWFWLLYRRPRRPSLALYERGFRSKNLIIPFDGLAAVRLGRVMSSTEEGLSRLNRTLGRFKRDNALAAEMMESMAANASLTLIFDTGEMKSLKNVLIRPDPEDVHVFFRHMRAMQPRLFESNRPR